MPPVGRPRAQLDHPQRVAILASLPRVLRLWSDGAGMTIAALRRIQDEAELTTAQLLENIEYLMPSCSPADIAARLGMEMEAIEKRCYRAGRMELAAPFFKAVRRQRRLEAGVVEQAHQGHVDLWEQVTIQVTGDRSAGVPQAPGNRQDWLAAG
jgi:hypothetical protein